MQCASPETLIVYLISGGASAIAEKPIRPNISLPDLVATYKALVHSGAPIAEINAIRKHLSAIKGGRLARAASGGASAFRVGLRCARPFAGCAGLGSNHARHHHGRRLLRHRETYGLLPHLPLPVHALFQQRLLQETPKPDDRAFSRAQFAHRASNETAVHAAVERAALGGFAVEVDNSCDDWDYREAADHLLRRLRELRRGVSRACLISGGEVTVKVDARRSSADATSNSRCTVPRKLPARRLPC